MTGRKLFIAATAACLAMATGGAFAGDGTTKSAQPVTDTMITTKVKAELAKDRDTKAKDIHVETKNGVVHLNGAVASMAEKDKAEQDVRSIEGVVDVSNKLKVASAK
jgi:hyperosmotically inducible periplasmic protein